jgi:carboxypeptidase C (cathepsin A)
MVKGAEDKAANKDEDQVKKSAPKEETITTHHRAVIDGQEVAYTATVGTILLKEEDGTSKASVFYVAYTRDGVERLEGRPLTFSFNGGPGSSSVWLHLGLLGPCRVLFDDEGYPLPPPYQLVNNDYSLLDVTDLVFIDPVGTGYSRAVPGEEGKQFYGFDKDIESVGEFIMLISAILNFQTARFDVGNDLPYILFLPTYTATAWYHGRLDQALQADLRATLAEVEAFIRETYVPALMEGAALPDGERAEVARALARYTGLSESYLEQTDLRIEIFRFVKELLRDQRRTVGRLDARFTGIDRDAAGERFDYDPSYAAIQGPYTATLNDYIRSTLRYESDLPYEILTGRVQPWDYSRHQNQYVNVAETLRKAMTQNQHLKVFVANGFYDLATPYLATRYTFTHLGIDPSLQRNISMGYYEAGHMMYIHMPSLAQLRSDLAAFVRSALPSGAE